MQVEEIERRGWYQSRGLPHRDDLYLIQAVTFRLADSLPQAFVAEYMALSKEERRRSVYRHRFEEQLDQGIGEAWLARSEIAGLVVEGVRSLASAAANVFAFVVMPTHVHLLIRPHEDITLGETMRKLKGATARQANLLIGRSGPFWAADYFDPFIRNEEHFRRCIRYIQENPVKAKLCQRAEDWPWSSAFQAGG